MAMWRQPILRGISFGLLLAVVLPAWPAAAREMLPASQADLIREVIPSVVNIAARIGVAEPPPTALAGATPPGATPPGATQSGRTQSGPTQLGPAYKISVSNGSGFVIDPAGLIATNWHVVNGAYEIVATFTDGTRLAARVVGAWRLIDLALLQVDAGHPLPAAHWGDSAAVQIGDPVLAMGNAFGIGLSVSAGIVSALNRNIGDSLVDDFIQTDAAINHGNSGGPLFNLKGEVIGVNSAILSPTAANAGLGFAIPSNDAQFVFQRMVNMPESERPAWLGAKLQAMTPEMAEAAGNPQLRGAIVAGVLPNEPAQKAGMRPGDVILRFDGDVFPDERALLRRVTMKRPGDTVTFTVWRDGNEIELTVTLATWPKAAWELNAAPPQPILHLTIPPDLGLTVTELTDAVRAAHAVPADATGVMVTAVAPDSEAARQGVVPGDLLLKVGSKPVQTPADVWTEVDRVRSEGRRFGLFMLMPKTPPADIAQFPGPNWIALRITGD